jgi:DNA-binding NarL/FixJ family response regulator
MSTRIATVMGGGFQARRDAAVLLADAGFTVSDGESTSPGALVVLVGEADAPTRLREIRTLIAQDASARVLAVMPADASNVVLRRALVAGASGIVHAGDVDAALGATARALAAGQLAVPQGLASQIAPRPLSHRERQILSLVVRGLTNRQIADELILAESTIKTHLSSAFRKIDARSRAEAVARIQDPEVGLGRVIIPAVDAAA